MPRADLHSLVSGIHLQDVTRLNDGKSDMRDGLVNWSKMKAIGKHCAIVIDCSRLAPHYPNNEDLSRLITRLPLYSLNDDDVRIGPLVSSGSCLE